MARKISRRDFLKLASGTSLFGLGEKAYVLFLLLFWFFFLFFDAKEEKMNKEMNKYYN